MTSWDNCNRYDLPAKSGSWSENIAFSDSKVHGANVGPTRVLSAPDRPYVGPTNLAIRVLSTVDWQHHVDFRPSTNLDYNVSMHTLCNKWKVPMSLKSISGTRIDSRAQSIAVITRYSIERYYMNNYRNCGRISIGCWIHKDTPFHTYCEYFKER